MSNKPFMPGGDELDMAAAEDEASVMFCSSSDPESLDRSLEGVSSSA